MKKKTSIHYNLNIYMIVTIHKIIFLIPSPQSKVTQLPTVAVLERRSSLFRRPPGYHHLGSIPKSAHTHIYTQTHTHDTHKHTHMTHTNTHTHTHTNTHTNTHAHSHIQAATRIPSPPMWIPSPHRSIPKSSAPHCTGTPTKVAANLATTIWNGGKKTFLRTLS